jgi:hypothetical protein
MNELTEAVRKFSEWRTNKCHVGEKIPEHLWEIACVAAMHVDIKLVARTLGIATKQLHIRMQQGPKSGQKLQNDGPDVLGFSIQQPSQQTPSPIGGKAEFSVGPSLKFCVPISISGEALKKLLTIALEVA